MWPLPRKTLASVHHVVDIRCPQHDSGWGYQISRDLLNERSAMTIAYRAGMPVRMVVRIGRDHLPMTDYLDLNGLYFRDTWMVFCGGGSNITAEGEAKLALRRRLAGVEGDIWKQP
jgi:hypothetical protein